jgi:ELWxxDGT repeat protein
VTVDGRKCGSEPFSVPPIPITGSSYGTPAGTTLVKDVNPGPLSSGPYGLTNVNGTLFFSAYDEAHAHELWKSDGTAAGTVLVKDIAAGPDSSSPGALVSAQGVLFFFADDLTHGPELWRSDGTAAGTRLVKDILPGPGGDYTNYPTSLTNANGTLFFVASDGVHHNTLWKSDGTVAGTLPVSDSLRLLGAGCSCSSWLTNVDRTLFSSRTTTCMAMNCGRPTAQQPAQLW